MALKDLWTIGTIAEHLGLTKDQVLYQIRSKRIKPCARVGRSKRSPGYRVFDDAAVAAIRKGAKG